MRVTLTASPDFRFKARNDTGYVFAIGASRKIGGDESGFRPMQLVLAALGSCSGIDILSILKKSRQEITGMEVEVEGERAEGVPSPFKSIHLRFRIEGRSVSSEKAERAVALGVDKYCSVAAMLCPTVAISHSVELLEA